MPSFVNSRAFFWLLLALPGAVKVKAGVWDGANVEAYFDPDSFE